jgi:Carboxypeptidase regulatory-like domain
VYASGYRAVALSQLGYGAELWYFRPIDMRIATGILLLCCTSLACACGIVSVSCNFLNDKSPVVFVGTVISPEDPATEVILHGSPVVFNVTEVLRGDVGKQISIYGTRSSCDFLFERGKSYLVFAYVENGRPMTSELTSTRPLWAAGALLRQLRALKQGAQPAALFGYLGEGGPTSERPMAGITIEAKSKRRTFTARTEADGSFQFAHLPPGQYSIKATLPKGYMPARTYARVKTGESCDLEKMSAVPNERKE